MAKNIMRKSITARGIRVHNLKNINIEIPLRKLVVITGVSGSGKLSLAFDTLYAEGQRRYVESFSAYARQFLERVDKPDVDHIEGIPPAIAIEQKNPVKNRRSTVGTATEINDYLRLLFARIGKTYCTKCKEIKPATEFHKNRSKKGGLSGECKVCVKVYGKSYRQTPRGRAMRALCNTRYRKTKKNKAYRIRYAKSPEGKAAINETMRRQRIAHPDRHYARSAVSNAIKTGKLPKATSMQCSYCSKAAEQYHHNKGYEPKHALDVVPACRICHRQLDRKVA